MEIKLTIHHYTGSETICHATADVSTVEDVRALAKSCRIQSGAWKSRAVRTSWTVGDPKDEAAANELISRALRVPHWLGALPFVQSASDVRP